MAQDTIELTTPIERLPRMTEKRALGLRRLGLGNVGRLIAHLPMRHECEAEESAIADLPVGITAAARGEVTATRPHSFGRAPRFEAVLTDDSGRLDLVWFHQPYLARRLHAGMRILVRGEAKRRSNTLQMINPRWQSLSDDAEPEAAEARLRPVYPASTAVKSWEIEQSIGSVLDDALPLIDDHLSPAYRAERELPELRDAYRMMHSPATDTDVAEARRRLAYDELLMLQLAVYMKRAQLRERRRAPRLAWSEALDKHILERFPFTLTSAQRAAIDDLVKDITTASPANRLVQGDVGSGKTIVALYAMLLAVADGHQAVLLAPTEILAEQHAASIASSLEGSKVRIELLTGSLPPQDRKAAHSRIAAGEADIVVGTHALLTETVRFKSLAVAVIDEQHRFGVHQRATLRTADEIDRVPHVIVMTATPIPRTLAMTLFGDLDVSTINELPPGRTPIATRHLTPDRRDEAYALVRERLKAGEQAFIVAPSIDGFELDGLAEESPDAESSTRTIAGVSGLLAELERDQLAGFRIAALHGRLQRDSRAHIMARFRAGLIDAVVATSVIEVGVDVPNATVMVIESAERFGLAQLHQLRGRVCRGKKRSVCVLIGEPTTPDGVARLEAMVQSSDGFALAERDLALRGPGELFGTRQAGASPLRVADLIEDRDLLAMARRDARAWIERSAELAAFDERVLRRRVLRAYGETFGLGDVG
ncbi:MAG: ATP-dependent DNA helicase RecG [Planctomycetota bacterium]